MSLFLMGIRAHWLVLVTTHYLNLRVGVFVTKKKTTFKATNSNNHSRNKRDKVHLTTHSHLSFNSKRNNNFGFFLKMSCVYAFGFWVSYSQSSQTMSCYFFHNIVLSQISRFSKKENIDHNIGLYVCMWVCGVCVCGRGLWTLCSSTGMSATRCKRHKNSLTFHRVMAATTTTTNSGLWMSCLPPTVIDPQRSGRWRAFYIVCLHKARQTTKRIMIHYFWLR